ncbi:hypothetical protein [Dapis sp. BLCC M126]|uniref:hypothetical protein n=1 Tax=Dapis sp. BLCC M126 TaxID=3400189 RepID=UPI003CF0BE77
MLIIPILLLWNWELGVGLSSCFHHIGQNAYRWFDLDLYHVRMITYNKAKIITVEGLKVYGQKDCDIAAALAPPTPTT